MREDAINVLPRQITLENSELRVRLSARAPARCAASFPWRSLVVVLRLVFWFTWQSIQSGQSANDWDFSTLMNRAADGQVKSVEINGTDGIAVDADGKKHNVVLPDCTGDDALAAA